MLVRKEPYVLNERTIGMAESTAGLGDAPLEVEGVQVDPCDAPRLGLWEAPAEAQ